jgi:hypothetical protein
MTATVTVDFKLERYYQVGLVLSQKTQTLKSCLGC